MGNASDLPMALWKANLDLQLRIGRLAQDSGREWMELGTRAAGEGAAEFDAEFRKLLRGGDWQALAALPVEAFWRQAEQRIGDGQALNQLAIRVQDGFVRGLVEALQDWQARLADAWSGAGLDGGAAPGLEEAWNSLLSQWESGLGASPFAPAAAARPAATGPAPAKKAPVKKAPVKKAAAKKPAAKKPAARKPAPAKKGSRKRGG